MSLTKTIAAAVGAATLSAGLFTVVPAMAEDDQAPAATWEQWREGRHERRESRRAAMAEELGISVEELEAAGRAAHEVVVAEHGQIEPGEIDPETMDARREAFKEALAAELGISVDELEQAGLAVITDRLDQAVANGRITQEQADEILGHAQDGTLRDFLRERRQQWRDEHPRPGGDQD